MQKTVLILLVVLCQGKQYSAEINLINELNKHLNIKWNLIINLSSGFNQEMEEFLKYTEKSILIKTPKDNGEVEEIERDLPSLFSYNVLTIIFQGNLERKKDKILSLETTFKFLVKTLKLIHFTSILWIIDDDQDQEEYLQQISELCWNYGFIRVLFLYNKNMYSYRPLPNIEVWKLTALKEFFMQKEITNYHQYPFRFPITSSPPRCYRYRDSQGHLVYAGYFYEILMTFIQQYNFKFIEHPNDYNSDHMDVLLQDLASNKIDAIPFLAYRNRNYAASDVLWNVNAVIMVPNAKPIPKYQYFEKPFENHIWIIYLLFALLSSLLLCLVVYLKNHKIDYSQALLYVLSLSIYQHHLKIFKNSSLISNSIYMLLFLFGFIMVQMYLCKLSSMLVLTIYEPQIQTLQDINATDLKLFMHTHDLLHFTTTSTLPSIILDRIIITDGIDLDNKRRSLNPSYFHMGFDDKIHFFLLQQKFLKVPLVQLIDPVILTEPIFFTMRHNLPFIQLFNRYLKYLADSGLLQQILQDIEVDGIRSGEIHYFKDQESSSDHLLSLEYFYSPLILYFGGVILSVVVFLVEICYYKFKARRYEIKQNIKV